MKYPILCTDVDVWYRLNQIKKELEELFVDVGVNAKAKAHKFRDEILEQNVDTDVDVDAFGREHAADRTRPIYANECLWFEGK